MAWNSTYVDKLSLFITSVIETDERRKKYWRYEALSEVKINRDNFVGLQLGSLEGCTFI